MIKSILSGAIPVRLTFTDTSLGESYLQDTNSVPLKRLFLGKERELLLDPYLEEEMTKVLWEEKVWDNGRFKNQIIQISPHLLLYSTPSILDTHHFFGTTQPIQIEFLDSRYSTIKMVDIWENRPFQTSGGKNITYYNFSAEGMSVLPYAEQHIPVEPNEYSISTQVSVVGNHVIVKFERLALKESTIVGMTVGVKVYDFKGAQIAEVNDLSSCDQLAVSPQGRFMMYSFGGNVGTVNQPFAKLEKPGWGLIDLKTSKIVFREYEKEGLSLGGVHFTQD